MVGLKVVEGGIDGWKGGWKEGRKVGSDGVILFIILVPYSTKRYFGF